MQSLLGYLIWDPKPGMFDFSLPLLNRPILWYGFFFALGFFLGYGILLHILRRYFPKDRITKIAEQLTFYVILGTVIGARLGDVLFYQDKTALWQHPLSLIAVWEGGLASHGGAIGILIALWLFARKNKLSFLSAVDLVVIPTALAAFFIRIGNFFNQEILGTPTQLPWGILFLHPADGGAIVPRHPAQLYEAIGYLCIFSILLFLWKHSWEKLATPGRLAGLFLVFVFSYRFLIEFVKMEQSVLIEPTGLLTMGQYLSIPFILLGVFLLRRKVALGIQR